jgi:hypothetical protein
VVMEQSMFVTVWISVTGIFEAMLYGKSSGS